MSNIFKPVPIIEQTIDILRKKILSGEFTSDGRLLSESDLADVLGVSRTTVRSALSLLEAEGAITRRHGAGTFINRRAMELSASLNRIWDFQNMILDSGRTPRVQLIEYSRRKVTDEEVELFEVDPGAEFLVLDRLFWADEEPVIFSTNLFPPEVFCGAGDEMRFDLPIHEFLAFHCSQKIGYSINNISAFAAPPEAAALLQIPVGKPVLQFVDFFYNPQDIALMYG
ncbi:MAG: GntR family transcriptional regulator, partial [Chloroflexota bacterium]